MSAPAAPIPGLNPLDLLAIAADIAGGQAITTTLADSGLIYEDYAAFKAGKLKVALLAQAGKLKPLVAALARAAALLEHVVEKDEAHVVALATREGL